MQYHLNGFVPGDLQLAESVRQAETTHAPETLPSHTDVLIVGCGPAGLTLARQLATFPEINTTIIEQKTGPILFGQADGVSCRTIEIMEAYSASELVLKESYWLNQTAFWDPDEHDKQRIIRSRKVPDARIGLSEFPHVVLNQARIHDLLLNGMRDSAAQMRPAYCKRLKDLTIDSHASAYPVCASIERLDDAQSGEIETVNAKYIVGCDGAHSSVRKLLGIPLRGDSANKAWGVMDALVVTDFPDIRVKSFIQSADHGSVMIVPREGGYLVRFYIELDQLQRDERIANRNVELEDLLAVARRIMRPYSLDLKEVPWWSVYEIGQRISDAFDNLPADTDDSQHPRAFIAGDACHTHSPKAGQGMNVSIHDGFNLGWKLASVLRRQSHPKILRSYSLERRKVAQDLIALDKTFAQLVAGKSPQGKDTSDIQRYLDKQNGFIAGTGIQYQSSLITASPEHQHLAKGFQIGSRFHSVKAARLSDGRRMHLGHLNKADGRWRIFIFDNAGNQNDISLEAAHLLQFLVSTADSQVAIYTPPGDDLDSVIDVCAVFQHQQNVSIEHMPETLLPVKGSLGLRDYEKVFSAIPEKDVFDLREINRTVGCMLIVRPDQHVAHILPLTAHKELSEFFEGFMLETCA